jgi:hypothetical protein
MTTYWLSVVTGVPLLFLILFIIGETYAYKHDRPTLSRWVWNLCKAFPLLPFVFGFFQGGLLMGLAVHFLWHWCPDLSAGLG